MPRAARLALALAPFALAACQSDVIELSFLNEERRTNITDPGPTEDPEDLDAPAFVAGTCDVTYEAGCVDDASIPAPLSLDLTSAATSSSCDFDAFVAALEATCGPRVAVTATPSTSVGGRAA